MVLRPSSVILDVDNLPTVAIAHAVLMSVAWLALTPLSVLIARVGKKMGSSRRILWMHVACNVLVVALTIAGFAMGLQIIPNSFEVTEHSVIGTLVTVLVVLQAINGLLRPAKTSSTAKSAKSIGRILWEWVHSAHGRMALSLGITNCVLGGNQLDKWGSDGAAARLVAIVASALWVVSYVFVELRTRRINRAPNSAVDVDHSDPPVTQTQAATSAGPLSA